jgi:hypothetical protein
MWAWIGAAFGLFIVYRVGQLLWWWRTTRLARAKRIEAGLADWQEANPGKRIPVDFALDIARDNWNG